MDDSGNGWPEYRRLVLAQIEEVLQRVGDVERAQRQEQQARQEEIVDRFDALANMHRSLIDSTKPQIIQSVKQQLTAELSKALIEPIAEAVQQKLASEETEVRVAKITGRWEFYGVLATAVLGLVVAIIGLLN